jgi:hypothetical protein
MLIQAQALLETTPRQLHHLHALCNTELFQVQRPDRKVLRNQLRQT